MNEKNVTMHVTFTDGDQRRFTNVTNVASTDNVVSIEIGKGRGYMIPYQSIKIITLIEE